MKPTERMPADEWARKNRVYPASAGRPGPRDPSFTPYVIDVARAFDDIHYEKVVFICGSQMGKSEVFLDVIGSRLDINPVPMLYVAPNREFLESEISPRISRLLGESRSLNAKWLKGKKDKSTQKIVSGVTVRMGWAGSANMLKGYAAGLNIIDELDGMEANVAGEGDPLALVEARGQTYADAKYGVTSTPTVGTCDFSLDEHSGLYFWNKTDPEELDSAIWRQFQLGTMFHYALPCPCCGEYFIPRFERLRWPKGCTPAEAFRQAYLLCPQPDCGGVMDEHAKIEALVNDKGRYVAPGQRVDRDGVVHGQPIDTNIASFWASGLVSRFKSVGHRAQDWLIANQSGKSENRQTVINTKFGELFAPNGGEVMKWEKVAELRQPYRVGEVPDWVQLVTCGTDVQKNSLYYVVRGWGHRGRSALLDFGQLFGHAYDTDDGLIGPVWDELAALLRETYDGLPIKYAFIDSGDGNVTQRVYQFCRDHRYNALAAKGNKNSSTHLKKNSVDITDKGKKLKYGNVDLWSLNSSHYKAFVHEKVAMGPSAKLGWWLPEDVTEDYCKQIVAEALMPKKFGPPEWKQLKKDNHFLDCEAYAAAAADMAGVQRLPEFSRSEYYDKLKTSKPKTAADYAAALNG